MKHKDICPLALMCCFLVTSISFSFAQPLAATDALGRTLVQNTAVGDLNPDRKVVLFYFLWQGDKSSPTSEKVWDLAKLSENHPEVFQDFDHEGWGGGAGVAGKYYFWGEPLYGYYEGHDYWVHLKNIQLLTDAGVDALAIDATNRLTFGTQANELMRAMETVRSQGKNPPKIIFYTNTNSGEAMQEIYENCYREGAPYYFPDSWFYLDGKPLIIGLSEQAKGKRYEDFFTIRESQWPNEPHKPNGWPWIEFTRPQHVYSNSKGEPEIVNVSTAQHPNLDASMGGSAFYGALGNWGRSYHNNAPGNPSEDIQYGYNFQEQWDFAISQNPPFVFVTGWNEWIVGKWRRASGNLNHALFVDQANPEFSRDIEPSLSAGLADNYYMQLVNNIRWYKGIAPLPVLSEPITVEAFEDWENVLPQYTDYTGDVLFRNHPSALSDPIETYLNKTGRNDFQEMKVARDTENVYFYAKTVVDVTVPSGENWMTVYLDMDRSHLSGWMGYDYRIVGGEQLQHYRSGQWRNTVKVSQQVSENQMMITVPLEELGILSDELNFEFKWSDNMQKEDPLDWYINGDAAPGGRFNFVVVSEVKDKIKE